MTCAWKYSKYNASSDKNKNLWHAQFQKKFTNTHEGQRSISKNKNNFQIAILQIFYEKIIWTISNLGGLTIIFWTMAILLFRNSKNCTLICSNHTSGREELYTQMGFCSVSSGRSINLLWRNMTGNIKKLVYRRIRKKKMFSWISSILSSYQGLNFCVSTWYLQWFC